MQHVIMDCCLVLSVEEISNEVYNDRETNPDRVLAQLSLEQNIQERHEACAGDQHRRAGQFEANANSDLSIQFCHCAPDIE